MRRVAAHTILYVAATPCGARDAAIRSAMLLPILMLAQAMPSPVCYAAARRRAL